MAAHFREPVRNYGVGGFSVYQAYRRMLLVEARDPVEYIILNIYDDDHFRNLESWRAIRWGAGNVGFTLPHVRVDVGQDKFEEVDNIIQQPEDVIKLGDREFVWEHFKDDMTLKLMLATKGKGTVSEKWIEPPETIFGLPLDKTKPGETTNRLRALHTEAALYASKRVVQLVEKFVEENNKKLMVILSFGRTNLRKCLNGEERFDRSFLAWIKGRGYHVADMLGEFITEFEQSKLPIEDFIHRYYIGHHTPAGNHFAAMAVKNAMIEWLDPKPLPYG